MTGKAAGRFYRISTAIVLAALFSGAAQAQLTAEQWREDLRYLVGEIKSRHPNPYHTTPPAQFEQMVEDLFERIPALERHEIIAGLAGILSAVGDAHTVLYLSNSDVGFRKYPIRIYQYEDGFYIQEATEEYTAYLGHRVIEIGEVPVEDACRAALKLSSFDSDFRPIWGYKYLVVAEVLHALGIIDDMEHARFVVEDREGNRKTMELSPLEEDIGLGAFETGSPRMVRARDAATAPLPLYLKDLDNYYWFDFLEDSGLFYMQINRWRDKKTGKTFRQFLEEAFAFVDSHPVDKFVIDLRTHRSGGDGNALSKPILHGIIKRDHFNRKGKLFVILGRRAYSAPTHMAALLERHAKIIFVGEPLGAGPNHYNDSSPFRLPNSKLRGSISTMYWQLGFPTDTRDCYEPQIAAELSPEDYRDNRDPALEAILAYTPSPSLDELLAEAYAQGGLQSSVAAYRAYKADPANRYRETLGALNQLGYQLLGEEKHEDAISIFQLNVEAYPESWIVFDSLAEAYMNAGKDSLAIMNYEKSISLNPGNWYGRDMLGKLKGR